MIKKQGSKWCLYTRNGKRKIKCFKTKKKALSMERAIIVSKKKRR